MDLNNVQAAADHGKRAAFLVVPGCSCQLACCLLQASSGEQSGPARIVVRGPAKPSRHASSMACGQQAGVAQRHLQPDKVEAGTRLACVHQLRREKPCSSQTRPLPKQPRPNPPPRQHQPQPPRPPQHCGATTDSQQRTARTTTPPLAPA